MRRAGKLGSSRCTRLPVFTEITMIEDHAESLMAVYARSTGGINEGIGLSTTRERLDQLYGAQQSFRMENATGGGTHVTITIPPQGPYSDVARLLRSSARRPRKSALSLAGRRFGGEARGLEPLVSVPVSVGCRHHRTSGQGCTGHFAVRHSEMRTSCPNPCLYFHPWKVCVR
jgi:hypothetical protein